MKTLNLILLIIAVFFVAFVGINLWFFYKFQQIPDTLVSVCLGSTVAELIMTTVIEVAKKKYDRKGEK